MLIEICCVFTFSSSQVLLFAYYLWESNRAFTNLKRDILDIAYPFCYPSFLIVIENFEVEILFEKFSTFRRVSLHLYFMKLVEFMKDPLRKVTEFRKIPPSFLKTLQPFCPAPPQKRKRSF